MQTIEKVLEDLRQEIERLKQEYNLDESVLRETLTFPDAPDQDEQPACEGDRLTVSQPRIIFSQDKFEQYDRDEFIDAYERNHTSNPNRD